MGDTRRLAAIMAVDVVGYSRLMGEDEAGTAAAVREHREAARPIVVGKGGWIVKTMGDGLLLEFPSVVAAVECAIAIQKLMGERNGGVPEAKRIVYRIGVNLGDVLIEGDDILGEGVNIAARLEALCEPGGVMISAAAHDHARGRIEAVFADLGERALKNIARPVRVFAVNPSGVVAASPAPAGPPRLSLVVLPFMNLSGGAEQDYFVDGVTENLTTDLSRIAGAFVISRSTAFAYKGKPVDVKQIGRELNVRYVLEGSVQRGGSRLRVNVQLIEAESGKHLWAERFDKPVADLFDAQDEIVTRLAAQLHAELIEVEARRAEKSPNPDVLDLVFQARAALLRSTNPEAAELSRRLCEQALRLDPDDVEALIQSGQANYVLGVSYSTDDPAFYYSEAEARLTRALNLAPNAPHALRILGSLYAVTGRAERGIEKLLQALAIDPNLARAHGALSLATMYAGRSEESEAHFVDALRLSPRDALVSNWLLHVGSAKALLKHYEVAAAWLRRSINANRSNPWAYFYLAACLAYLGRGGEASREMAAGLAVNPRFTLARFRAAFSGNHPVFVEQTERILDGMRQAGAPEE